MGMTKPKSRTETKLDRIAHYSRHDADMKFNWLMPHFNKESLTSCFWELDGTKAAGAVGITKEDYAQNLDQNIQSLVERMKRMAYRPGPVLEVLIPKKCWFSRE